MGAGFEQKAGDLQAILLFLAVTFGWSWTWWLALVLGGDTVEQRDPWPSQFPGLIGPLIGAMAVTAYKGGRSALEDYGRRLFLWRIGARPWGLVVVPPLVFFAVAVLADSGVDVEVLDNISGLPELGVPLLLAVLIVVNGFGEEGGWRGFLFPWFRQRYSHVPASLAVTVIWALWHLPLFFLLASYQEFSPFILLGFLIGLAAGSVVLGWIYEQTGASILAAAVWHGTYNLVAATGASEVRSSVVTAFVIAWAVSIMRYQKRGHQKATR